MNLSHWQADVLETSEKVAGELCALLRSIPVRDATMSPESQMCVDLLEDACKALFRMVDMLRNKV